MSTMTITPTYSYSPSELRLTRRGRLVVLIGALLVVLALGVFWGAGSVATEQPGTPEPTLVVTVQPGDTLYGIAATVTRPRCSVNRWRSSSSALSQSAISRRARGNRDSPSGVSATLRVLRLNKRPPNPSSKPLIVRLSAD